MALTWIQALKKWNSTNTCWCVPRKGTEQYNEVMALMKDGRRYIKEESEETRRREKNKEKETIK